MIEVMKEYYDNGNIWFEYYILDKKIHRKDGPAYIEYHQDGNIWFLHYYLNGLKHREDGPAHIEYDEKNRNILLEEYYLNGKCHREDGPAVISYDKSGEIKYKEYWLNNEELKEQEWFSLSSENIKLKMLLNVLE